MMYKQSPMYVVKCKLLARVPCVLYSTVRNVVASFAG